MKGFCTMAHLTPRAAYKALTDAAWHADSTEKLVTFDEAETLISSGLRVFVSVRAFLFLLSNPSRVDGRTGACSRAELTPEHARVWLGMLRHMAESELTTHDRPRRQQAHERKG